MVKIIILVNGMSFFFKNVNNDFHHHFKKTQKEGKVRNIGTTKPNKKKKNYRKILKNTKKQKIERKCLVFFSAFAIRFFFCFIQNNKCHHLLLLVIRTNRYFGRILRP